MHKPGGIGGWIARTFFHELYRAWKLDTRPGRARRFALQTAASVAAIAAIAAGAARWPKQADALIERLYEAEQWLTAGFIVAIALALAIAVPADRLRLLRADSESRDSA